MRTKYKPWAEPYLELHKEVQLFKEDYSSIHDVDLEIGCGKGGFLFKKALAEPNKKFIGVEKNISCAGITAKALVEAEITNAKLIYDFAESLTPELKDNCINTLYLNFSDPWPKKRHHKRRLTTDKFLNEYYRIINKNGLLIFKTDNIDLFEFTLETLSSSKFVVVNVDRNYQLAEDDQETEYEQSFRKEGLPIYRLVAKKE